MAKHNNIGTKGEQEAMSFLTKQGYTVLEINWRNKHLEIDIIATNANELVIVEVKTRSSTIHGQPQESVTIAKQKKLIKAAEAYVIEKNIEMEVRFDIIEVIHHPTLTINHIKNAYYAQW